MDILTLPVGLLAANCYVVYSADRQAVIVDPGAEPQQILNTVREQGLTVTAVILTHVHFDHIMGAEEVCVATGAPLLVGAADVPALTDSDLNLIHLFKRHENLSLRADVLLREGDSIPLGGESLTVIETPGHTPGSICLRGENGLLSGDTLFSGAVGRTDFPGGDAAAMQQSLQKLMTLPDALPVYPGHNEPTTIGKERLTNPFILH